MFNIFLVFDDSTRLYRPYWPGSWSNRNKTLWKYFYKNICCDPRHTALSGAVGRCYSPFVGLRTETLFQNIIWSVYRHGNPGFFNTVVVPKHLNTSRTFRKSSSPPAVAQRLRRAVSQIHKKCNFRPKSRHRRLLGGTGDETHTAKRARKHPDACMEASIFEAFGSDAYAVEGGWKRCVVGKYFRQKPSYALWALWKSLKTLFWCRISKIKRIKSIFIRIFNKNHGLPKHATAQGFPRERCFQPPPLVALSVLLVLPQENPQENI